jgi:hypothetical protein
LHALEGMLFCCETFHDFELLKPISTL